MLLQSVKKDNSPNNKSEKRRLSQYKEHLRALASKKVSSVKKKRLLTQKGGNLLAALFPPVLRVLSNLLKPYDAKRYRNVKTFIARKCK